MQEKILIIHSRQDTPAIQNDVCACHAAHLIMDKNKSQKSKYRGYTALALSASKREQTLRRDDNMRLRLDASIGKLQQSRTVHPWRKYRHWHNRRIWCLLRTTWCHESTHVHVSLICEIEV